MQIYTEHKNIQTCAIHKHLLATTHKHATIHKHTHQNHNLTCKHKLNTYKNWPQRQTSVFCTFATAGKFQLLSFSSYKFNRIQFQILSDYIFIRARVRTTRKPRHNCSYRIKYIVTWQQHNRSRRDSKDAQTLKILLHYSNKTVFTEINSAGAVRQWTEKNISGCRYTNYPP
jgi:hypothetical protein